MLGVGCVETLARAWPSINEPLCVETRHVKSPRQRQIIQDRFITRQLLKFDKATTDGGMPDIHVYQPLVAGFRKVGWAVPTDNSPGCNEAAVVGHGIV